MRKRTFAIGVLFTLAAMPALAQKINIDYDTTVDFSQYETFAWFGTPEVSLADTDPLMHSRLKNAVEYQLTTGGMVEDTDNPDVYVTYHGEEWEEMRINTDHWGYGYGPGWRWDPYWGSGMSSTTVQTYSKGTLIIDIWDAQTKKMVWRGTATGTIPTKPQKAANKIDKAVAKMAKRWERMYQGR